MASKNKVNSSGRFWGIYWRKLIFFGVFSFFVLGLLQNIAYFSADFSNPFSSTVSGESYDLELGLDVRSDGTLLVNGKRISERVRPLDNIDEIRFPIIDNPGRYYDEVTVRMTLPDNFAHSVTADIKGIHGVGSVESRIENDNTIIYTASEVDPAATISIIAGLPKGYIKEPIAVRAFFYLNQLKANFYIWIALIFPITTLIYMMFLVLYQIRRNRIDIPSFATEAPPMAIPPAVVGVLYHQRVGSREIAATLIDLALRGDIYILDRERDFAFAKNKFDQRLLSYEKILLAKIFNKGQVSSQSEIEENINKHLYSKKISLVASGIYSLSTRLGYFKQNPQQIHSKYTYTGLGMFFLGVAGFFASLVYFTDPPYAAFFWVGMIAASLIIVYVSRKIPIRSVLGQESLSNWIAFRNFLTKAEKIPFSYENLYLFQKYLPYAIVLNCEVAWAKRFEGQNFVLPDWYITDKAGLGLEDFCLSLFPIVSYVGRSLSAIREPGFE